MEQTKKKHVGCYGIVTTDKNEVLLIRKARGAYKGKLDLPGGGIEYKETPEETLKREFLEEVGINIDKFELLTVKVNYVIWADDQYNEDLQHIGIIYKVELSENDFSKIKKDADGLDSLGASLYPIDKLDIEELSPFAKIIKTLN